MRAPASRRTASAGVCALWLLNACSTAATTDPARDAEVDAAADDARAADDAEDASTQGDADAAFEDVAPDFSAQERELLATLRYDDGPPPMDPSNRVAEDAAARAFGQKLFFDPSLSGPLIEGDNDGTAGTLGLAGEAGKVSCASCHLPSAGFVDTRSPHRQISLAARWTTRRTPTLLEVAFAPLYNWDGRRDSIWNQAIGVMESDAEFNSGRLFVAQQISRLHREEYESIFGAMPALDDADRFAQLLPEEAGCIEKATREGAVYVCRGKPGDAADYDALSSDAQLDVTTVTVNVAKAIAAYVMQLRCGPSRFDDWLDGDEDALSPSEQRGAQVFVGRGRCASCHSGPNFTDGAFHNVGLAPAQVAVAFIDRDDRGAATGIAAALEDPLSTSGVHSDGDRGALPAQLDAKLEGAFRTPTLRCMNARPSFMHTGQLRTPAQVIAFFDRGGDSVGNYPGVSELAPLGLSEREREDLAAFMAALEGPGPGAALLSSE